LFVQPDDRYLRRVMGQRIRQHRRLRGLSQVALAEILDCRQSWVSKIESGQSRLSHAQLRTLCLVLGITADELLSI
jgi:transcriptional regulator with XRE-family HTH domain